MNDLALFLAPILLLISIVFLIMFSFAPVLLGVMLYGDKMGPIWGMFNIVWVLLIQFIVVKYF